MKKLIIIITILLLSTNCFAKYPVFHGSVGKIIGTQIPGIAGLVLSYGSHYLVDEFLWEANYDEPNGFLIVISELWLWPQLWDLAKTDHERNCIFMAILPDLIRYFVGHPTEGKIGFQFSVTTEFITEYLAFFIATELN